MFGVAPMLRLWDHDVRKCTKPFDGFFRLVEPPHVCVARREKAVGRGPIRFLLQRLTQHRPGFVKLPSHEMGYSYPHEGVCFLLAGVEAQGGLEMLDREIELPAPQSEPPAPSPTTCRARIELQAAVQ